MEPKLSSLGHLIQKLWLMTFYQTYTRENAQLNYLNSLRS